MATETIELKWDLTNGFNITVNSNNPIPIPIGVENTNGSPEIWATWDKHLQNMSKMNFMDGMKDGTSQYLMQTLHLYANNSNMQFFNDQFYNTDGSPIYKTPPSVPQSLAPYHQNAKLLPSEQAQKNPGKPKELDELEEIIYEKAKNYLESGSKYSYTTLIKRNKCSSINTVFTSPINNYRFCK